MAREERFTFLCTEEERQLITAVARKLDRNRSDAIRVVMRGVAEELGVTAKSGGGQEERYAERS